MNGKGEAAVHYLHERTEASQVKTAGGSLQGNIPMQIIFAIVNFRGRGT